LSGVGDKKSFHLQLGLDLGAAFLECCVDFRVGDFQWVILKVKEELLIVCLKLVGWSSGWSP
jgi:hypothetical protein